MTEFIKRPHTTEQELDFIRELSRNGFIQRERKYDPKAALLGYMTGCQARTSWVGIDKENVLNYARVMLGSL